MGSLSATGFSSSNVALWTGNLDLRLATSVSTGASLRGSPPLQCGYDAGTALAGLPSRSRLAAGSIAGHGFGDARAKALQRQRAGAL